MIMSTEQLAPTLGVATACDILQVPRSSVYRARQPQLTPRGMPEPVRALSPAERDAVHHTLNTERFADQAPREVYATLLDEGTYLCSPSTMYRVFTEHTELRERRDQLRHAQRAYTKPELLATRPTRSGVGTSPSYGARRSGRITISTSSWTSSAAPSSAG